MSNAFRQITAVGSNGVSTAALQQVFNVNVAAGSQLSVFVFTLASVAVTVTDSLGNTYTQAGGYSALAGLGRMSLWYAVNTPAGAPLITVSLASATPCDAYMLEHSGTKTSAPIDGTGAATGTSASPSPGAIAVAGTADLVLAAYMGSTVGAIGYPVSGFTSRAVANTGNWKIQIVDALAASSVQTPTFATSASGSWAALGASFLVQPSPPPPPPPVNIYRQREAGPPILGMPWFVPMPKPPGMMQAEPPQPIVPGPPVPPSPPGPPVPPTLPPVPTGDLTVGDLAPDESAPVMVRRFMQQWSDEHNSLVSTGQLVLVDGEYRLVVWANGLTGPIGDP